MSACSSNATSSGSDQEPATSSASSDSEAGATTKTTAIDRGEPPAAGSAFVDTSSIHDPVGDDLVFACNGLVASAADLAQAFESTSVPLDAITYAFAAYGDVVNNPEFANWARLETGFLIDRDPLVSNPAAYLVATPEGDTFPCALRRAGFFELRPLAWELVEEGVVALERCIDPETVLVDDRAIGDQRVVTLFGPYQDEGETDCAVDGTVTMSLDVSTKTVSGLVYPFRPASARVFEMLGFGRGVGSLDTPTEPALECSVVGAQGGVKIDWSYPAAGFTVTVLADDVSVYSEVSTRLEASAPVLDAMSQRPAGSAALELSATGLTYTNVLAPGDRLQNYQIQLSATGVDPVAVNCGSAQANNFGAEPQPEVPVAATDLAGAADLFAGTAIGPYAYMTVVPVCDGCVATSFQLQLAPGGPNGHQFSPSLVDQTGGEAAGILNPFGVHAALDEAIAAGDDVSYEIDAKAGVIRRYTINGVGAEVLCIEVDTAPPELRTGRACNPEWDLMS